MRLNDASGVPHHPGRISAPVRAGRRYRALEGKAQARACLRPTLPPPVAEADAEARYAHHHGRADYASGIGARTPKISLIELELAFAELRSG